MNPLSPSALLRKVRPGLFLGLIALMASAQQEPVPTQPVKTPPPVSTSVTGQFIVHGSDLATRGAFCMLCDDIAAALGRLLRDEARYVLPVNVVLRAPQESPLTAPAVNWNISQLAHGGFHLQVSATLRGDFNGDDFARDLVRVLIAERILRHHKELKTTRKNVLPSWVLTGVTHALEFRGRSRPSLLFAAVFRSGQIYSVDKILSADPAKLDALARGIYETSACALVLTLLDQQDGPLRFAKFLDALAREDKSERDLLRQCFPGFSASKNSIEKWWALQMATLATPTPMETLGVEETEARLREALTVATEPAKEKAAPVKIEKPAPQKDEGRKPLFSTPSGPPPFTGGKKILFTLVNEAGTDGAPETSQKKSKEEKPEAPKRSMLNPLNWFRSKEKSPPEPLKKEKEPADKKKSNAPALPLPQENLPIATGPDTQRLTIDDFTTILKRPDHDRIFTRSINKLNALKVQAHPLFRPLIAEYTAAIRLLSNGKQKGLTVKFTALREQHQKILELARAVESHVDWYEASQTRGYSGIFDDYLKAADELERKTSTRNDALSKYLDKLSQEFGE